ncbi:hypothetical protein WN73_21460 [Bradyrhizobium sp. CCBAU 45394]|uniref:hypothetical protein n=1 Tax=Bradyrhizobium sp. CCBAU 45394 TaxID=1325087 RepID=UPI002304809E|nr:hypothetical protein [Bradyrhizobium sp. CCBAU 45394]MDA9393088.1 hypothetical protein [Bradyrhizobium sp. CCBAU 45394]
MHFEESRHLGQWDQTLTLLWFDDEELAPQAPEYKRWDEENYGLRELDEVLAQRACLSCIYEAEQEEFTREHHIAEHLGAPVEEVIRRDGLSHLGRRPFAG